MSNSVAKATPPKLTSKTQRDLDEVKSRLSNIEKYLIPQKQGDVIQTSASDLDEVKSKLSNIEKYLIPQKQGDEIEASASYITETMPEPNEGNGEEQVASLDEGAALGAVFSRLFEAVIELKYKTVIFKPHLENLKFTLDSLQPVIKELARHDKVLEWPKEEVENFRIDMEQGVELIHKCSKVRPWAFYKKYKYTDQLFGLDESLQRQLNILLEQVASKSRENLVLVRNLETAIENIGKSEIVQNQGLCAIPESPSHTVELDVPNKQGTRDLKEALVNVEVGIKGSTDVVQNQTEIKGSSALPEPPLSTVGLDVLNRQGTSDVNMSETLVLRNIEVPEPSLPTVRLDVPKVLRKRHVDENHETLVLASNGERLLMVFKLLYEDVEEIVQKGKFKHLLESIKYKLHSLLPLIMEHYWELGSHDHKIKYLTIQMEKGIKLVDKLSKLRKQNSYKKYIYTKQVRELDCSLQDLLKILKSVQEFKLKEIKASGMVRTQAAWRTVPELPSFTVGLDMPLNELKRKLLKDDGVPMLVVIGPGGCGKTTLATKFCQDDQVKDKFKNVFFVKSCQFKASARALRQVLEEARPNLSLLVVDDMHGSDQESLLAILDAMELEFPTFKILVTSRSEFIPGFGFPFYLKPLDHDNGMELFHHSASLGEKSSHHIPEDLSRKIVEHCHGLPLAITVIGKSLCGQPIEIWQKRVIEWSKGSMFDFENDMLVCLQSSLDALDEEKAILKECFVDLGSFPEDQRIPFAALIDMWAELYELHEDSTLSITNLSELTSLSLANLVVTRKEKMEVDGYYSEHFVTQHHMLRELAIYQTELGPIEDRKRLNIDICENNFPKWWTEHKYHPKKARLVSISTDGVFSTNWHNLQLPEAEVLVLNFQTKDYDLPEFVEKMGKLKVLIVTNYGVLPAKLRNFKLLSRLPNLKRIRLEGISISSITKYPIHLRSLQKISSFMCDIGQASGKYPIQIFEAFPNLVEMNIDYCYDLEELPAELCDLIHLKKLSITNCHKLSALPEGIGKLVNVEVLRLTSCTDLLELPGSTKDLKKLNYLDISYCFSIKELPEDIGKLESLSKLDMRQCSRLQKLPPSVSDFENLQEVICDEETKRLWKPFIPRLKNVDIREVN